MHFSNFTCVQFPWIPQPRGYDGKRRRTHTRRCRRRRRHHRVASQFAGAHTNLIQNRKDEIYSRNFLFIYKYVCFGMSVCALCGMYICVSFASMLFFICCCGALALYTRCVWDHQHHHRHQSLHVYTCAPDVCGVCVCVR